MAQEIKEKDITFLVLSRREAVDIITQLSRNLGNLPGEYSDFWLSRDDGQSHCKYAICIDPDNKPEEEFFIVRGYDVYDRCWFDISGPVSRVEADRVYNEVTNNRTAYTRYSDGCYYKIFQA